MKEERAIAFAAVVVLHAGLYLVCTVVFTEKRPAEETSDLVLVVPMPLTPEAPQRGSSARSSDPGREGAAAA
jgi:hypothetical protein